MKRTKKRTVLYIAAAVILIVLICLAVYLKSVSNYKQAVSDITFQNIDVAKIADGTYVGECDVDFIYAKVEVTVQEGRIADIEILEHRNERGQAAETVIDKIVTKQKIDVDAVSGATNSSIVLKKAVEKALAQQTQHRQLTLSLMSDSHALAEAVRTIRETVKVVASRDADMRKYRNEIIPYQIPALIAVIF